MMGVERIIKPESDTEPFPGSVGCNWLYFFALAGGNRVECDWKAKPYSAVKPAVNVRMSGQLLPKGGEPNLIVRAGHPHTALLYCSAEQTLHCILMKTPGSVSVMKECLTVQSLPRFPS